MSRGLWGVSWGPRCPPHSPPCAADSGLRGQAGKGRAGGAGSAAARAAPHPLRRGRESKRPENRVRSGDSLAPTCDDGLIISLTGESAFRQQVQMSSPPPCGAPARDRQGAGAESRRGSSEISGAGSLSVRTSRPGGEAPAGGRGAPRGRPGRGGRRGAAPEKGPGAWMGSAAVSSAVTQEARPGDQQGTAKGRGWDGARKPLARACRAGLGSRPQVGWGTPLAGSDLHPADSASPSLSFLV